MSNYPEVVAKIADDYLDRLRLQLRAVPVRERQEFVSGIQSQILEAYQNTPGDDDVVKILAVLRALGEPADVIAQRLPEAMVRSGTQRIAPLHILAGIVIAFFGIPLGFGGVAVLAGILMTLAAMVATYFATAAVVSLTGALFLLVGLTRIYRPGLWDRLVTAGVIQMDVQVAELLEQLAPSEQGLIMIVFAAALVAAGLGMLWLGRFLIQGLRFLFSLAFDSLRQFAQAVRRKLRQETPQRHRWRQVSFVK